MGPTPTPRGGAVVERSPAPPPPAARENAHTHTHMHMHTLSAPALTHRVAEIEIRRLQISVILTARDGVTPVQPGHDLAVGDLRPHTVPAIDPAPGLQPQRAVRRRGIGDIDTRVRVPVPEANRGLLPWGAPGATYGLMALGSGGGRFLRAHPPRQPCPPPPPPPSLGIRSAKNPLDTTRTAVA